MCAIRFVCDLCAPFCPAQAVAGVIFAKGDICMMFCGVYIYRVIGVGCVIHCHMSASVFYMSCAAYLGTGNSGCDDHWVVFIFVQFEVFCRVHSLPE